MEWLKKIDKDALEKTFDQIVEPLRKRAKELGLKAEEIESVIHEHREQKAKGT